MKNQFWAKVNKDSFEKDSRKVETELENNNKKVLKLEAEIQDMQQKFLEKDQTVSKINKKFNFLKEKVTLLFDLEVKFDNLEKQVEKIHVKPGTDSEKDTVSEEKTPQNSSVCSKEVKCDLCDFVAKNKFGLKIHFHKKHSSAGFKCFTCDFTCETHSELVDHSDIYYYSNRKLWTKNMKNKLGLAVPSSGLDLVWNWIS